MIVHSILVIHIFHRFYFQSGVDGCSPYYTVFPNAIGFSKQVTRLENVVLSVRWVTCKRAVEDRSYSKSNTDEMFRLLKEAGVDKIKGQAVNIFIRGHYANRSRDDLMELFKKVNETNPVTFSLYTDEQYWFNETSDTKPKKDLTPPNIPETRAAIEFFGAENIYLQVSYEIRAELDLRRLSNPRASTISVSSVAQLNCFLLIAFVAKQFIENFVLY